MKPLSEVDPSSLKALPVFFFVQDNFITMQVGDGSPVPITAAADLGEIKAALLVDDAVYLIRDQDVQRVMLESEKADVILHFDHAVINGQFFLTKDGSRISSIGKGQSVIHPISSKKWPDHLMC